MKKVEIKGIIPPIITPMNEDETINEAELRNQVNRQIKGGVHGLFPFGTNGEGYILSEAEKEQVLGIVIDETKGRVPVYAGTGCISTKDTIRQSRMAQSLGADVLSIITPSFAAASQNELYEHYRAVAEAVDMPLSSTIYRPGPAMPWRRQRLPSKQDRKYCRGQGQLRQF